MDHKIDLTLIPRLIKKFMKVIPIISETVYENKLFYKLLRNAKQYSLLWIIKLWYLIVTFYHYEADPGL